MPRVSLGCIHANSFDWHDCSDVACGRDPDMF